MNDEYANGGGMQPQAGAAPATEGQAQSAGAVSIERQEDGTFAVNGKPAATIDDALNMAREVLTGDDGGMSVQEAFGKGFGGDTGPGY